MQALRKRLGAAAPFTYEFEVVAQHASELGRVDGPAPRCGSPPVGGGGASGAKRRLPPARRRRRTRGRPGPGPLHARPPIWLPYLSLVAELPLPVGARAQFLLKRRSRLCVTEPEAVDGAGGVEWNTRCVQVGRESCWDNATHCAVGLWPAVVMLSGSAKLQHKGSRQPHLSAAGGAATRRCSAHAQPACAARHMQTATLFKEGDAWRPKEFVFKVQRVLGGWHGRHGWLLLLAWRLANRCLPGADSLPLSLAAAARCR